MKLIYVECETTTKKMRGDILKSNHLKDYLIYAVRGISMYAHRARRFALTDSDIDLFVANCVSTALSDTPMDVNQACRWLKQVEEVRNRANTLYNWGCDLFGREPDELTDPATLVVIDDHRHVVQQARLLSLDRSHKSRDQIYWEEACWCQLSRLATMAARSWGADLSRYDIYGFLHETLDCLAEEQKPDVLEELNSRIKEANFKMANVLVAGDTLTKVPLSELGLETPDPPPVYRADCS